MDFRAARLRDLVKIARFIEEHVRDDVFDSRKRLKSFILREKTMLCFDDNKLIALAVVQRGNDAMIRLLVHPNYRGKGIGKQMIAQLNPQIIRSKTDQSTGDPTDYYTSIGYEAIGALVGRKKNVQLMQRHDNTEKKAPTST